MAIFTLFIKLGISDYLSYKQGWEEKSSHPVDWVQASSHPKLNKKSRRYITDIHAICQQYDSGGDKLLKKSAHELYYQSVIELLSDIDTQSRCCCHSNSKFAKFLIMRLRSYELLLDILSTSVALKQAVVAGEFELINRMLKPHSGVFDLSGDKLPVDVKPELMKELSLLRKQNRALQAENVRLQLELADSADEAEECVSPLDYYGEHVASVRAIHERQVRFERIGRYLIVDLTDSDFEPPSDEQKSPRKIKSSILQRIKLSLFRKAPEAQPIMLCGNFSRSELQYRSMKTQHQAKLYVSVTDRY